MKIIVACCIILLLIEVIGCTKQNYDNDIDYIWQGSLASNDEFDPAATNCVGSINPCNGNGNARINISSAAYEGYYISFYYNERLIKRSFSKRLEYCQECNPKRTVYYDEQGMPIIAWLYSFNSPSVNGLFLETFPFRENSQGGVYMNFFTADL